MKIIDSISNKTNITIETNYDYLPILLKYENLIRFLNILLKTKFHFQIPTESWLIFLVRVSLSVLILI